MADIFISYAREDELRVQPIVAALEERGFSVFWDHRIPSGQTRRSYIGQALKNAGYVIAVWTAHSVVSDLVSEEADEGKKRNALLPILLDPVEPPIGFRSLQASDLTDWKTAEPPPQFDQLVDDINMVLKTTRSARPEKKDAEKPLTKSSKPKPHWIKDPLWQWTIGIRQPGHHLSNPRGAGYPTVLVPVKLSALKLINVK